eukprot:TRINITY_DN9921_c0_g1_i1.p1 TRINITY_DN9921_c0_g1~~TRINITY_DN9921_c0_g1_i1.p1  ORF type:complete len:234 (+),score=58.91 TRINITY_DN9921_c0_g1_i1:63-764(+)
MCIRDRSIMERDKQIYQAFVEQYLNEPSKKITYGTAGFRDQAKYLRTICYRTGIVTAQIAKYHSKNQLALGVMITASHNPIQDNGMKIADIDGGMITSLLEKDIEHFANTQDIQKDFEDLDKNLQAYFKREKQSGKPIVIIGRDTRPSSDELANLVKEGVTNNEGVVIDLGYVTTPMLHHAVAYFNTGAKKEEKNWEYYQANPSHLVNQYYSCLLYTSPSPRDRQKSRMPSSA